MKQTWLCPCIRHVNTLKEGTNIYRNLPLYWIWICDVSDSMNKGDKIGYLNEAIKEGIIVLRQLSPAWNLKIFIHTLKFSTFAEWMEEDFIPVNEYRWTPLLAEGVTDLGEAFSKVSDIIRFREGGGQMPRRYGNLPRIVLITDGYPTDDWESGFRKLMSTDIGKMAVKTAFALPGADLEILRQFVENVSPVGARIPDSYERLITVDAPFNLIERITDYIGMEFHGY